MSSAIQSCMWNGSDGSSRSSSSSIVSIITLWKEGWMMMDQFIINLHTLLDYQASSFSKAGKLTGLNRHGGELIEVVNV